MRKYELLYIISADQTEEKREALIEKFKKFVEDRKGVIAGIDKWGMKKLAYPINFKTEGFYVLMTFEADTQIIRELENAMNLIEAVVRKMITVKE